MGALFCLGVVSDGLSWIVWVGVGVIAVHVALSIGTTRQMLFEKSRLPSTKKKAHQLKKWVSGIAVGVVAAAHVLLIPGSASWVAVVLLLDAVLAAHTCVSAKSLVKDLGIASGFRHAIRALAVIAAILISAGVCISHCGLVLH